MIVVCEIKKNMTLCWRNQYGYKRKEDTYNSVIERSWFDNIRIVL